jgi:hypothetical protein
MRKGFDEERLGRKRFKTMDSRLSLARLEQISFSEDNVREFKG